MNVCLFNACKVKTELNTKMSVYHVCGQCFQVLVNTVG